jgi:tRNA nucleotidyltransferase (CCA-adding enzyme)
MATVRPGDPTARLQADPQLLSAWDALGLNDAWVAGGWIRDAVLGRPSRDLDLVVRGDPDLVTSGVRRLASALGARAHLVGKPPRAVWRIDGTVKAEIWPLGDLNPEADARRRDFTLNAMLWRLPDGPLLDPTGGQGDCARGVVRAVSRRNLEEDPVRLLRGPRIAAALPGFIVEEGTLDLILDLAPTLSAAPRERVGSELLTMAHLEHPTPAFEHLIELDLVSRCAPRGASTAAPGTAHRIALQRLGGRMRHPLPGVLERVRPVALLAWLVALWEVPGSRQLSEFSWPQEAAREVMTAARHIDRCLGTVDGSSARRREALADLDDAAESALVVAAAFDAADRTAAWRRWWRQWCRNRNLLSDPPLHLTATEVAELRNIDPGPELGRALASLRRAVIRGEVRSPGGARRWLRRNDQSCPESP